jgi:hypothetical protein
MSVFPLTITRRSQLLDSLCSGLSNRQAWLQAVVSLLTGVQGVGGTEGRAARVSVREAYLVRTFLQRALQCQFKGMNLAHPYRFFV